MNNTIKRLAWTLRAAAAWAGTVALSTAHAVKDLPGGPAVNQLNLHHAVTKIAQEQAWLHWMMLIICTVVFVLVFGVMVWTPERWSMRWRLPTTRQPKKH